MSQKQRPADSKDQIVERLREFLRFNHMTGSRAARQIGVRDTIIYSWLQGISTPRSFTTGRIIAFLQSLPAERAGITSTGYEYKPYPTPPKQPSLARSVARPEERFEKSEAAF